MIRIKWKVTRTEKEGKDHHGLQSANWKIPAITLCLFSSQAMFFADQLLSKRSPTSSGHSLSHDYKSPIRTELPVGAGSRGRIPWRGCIDSRFAGFLTIFPTEIIQATYRICSAVLFKSFLNPAIRGDFPVQMIMKWTSFCLRGLATCSHSLSFSTRGNILPQWTTILSL